MYNREKVVMILGTMVITFALTMIIMTEMNERSAFAKPLPVESSAVECECQCSNIYRYNAKVTRWVDGDTIELNVDLGFRIWLFKEKLRLIRVNTPERGRVGFKKSVKFVNDWAPPGTTLRISITKEGKYGRWLVELWRINEAGNAIVPSINDLLIKKGWVYR